VFLKLRCGDIVAVCRKNGEAGQITSLFSLTGIYIAWSFLFICDVINAFERKASHSLCAVLNVVSYMPSCGHTKLRLALYQCIQCRDCFAQSLSWVTSVILSYFVLNKSTFSLLLLTKVLTLLSLMIR